MPGVEQTEAKRFGWLVKSSQKHLGWESRKRVIGFAIECFEVNSLCDFCGEN